MGDKTKSTNSMHKNFQMFFKILEALDDTVPCLIFFGIGHDATY